MATSTSHSAPRRGRREHRKHVTRRELLGAGRKLFGDLGLYESRIEDLTRQAGVAKGTLYSYFANKEELIDAVVTSGFSELHGHVHREVEGARTHADVVGRLVDAHFTFFRDNPDLMRIFHQVRGMLKFNRPGSERLRRVLATYLRGLAGMLALHHTRPPGGERGLWEAALLLFGAVSGIASTRASVDGHVPHQRSRATARALVAMALAFETGDPRGPGGRGRAAADRGGSRPPRPRRSGTGRARPLREPGKRGG